jgi:hypothetical protein
MEPDYKQTTLDLLPVVERHWHRFLPYQLRLHLGYYCSPLFVNCGKYCDHKTALLSEEPAACMAFIDWMARTSRKKKKQAYSN